MTGDPETLDGGRYHVERVIGVGGSATVLLVQDTRMRVQRAIKLLQPQIARVSTHRARFMAEAHAQAKLQHPNILMVHDAIEDAQGVYLVMEYAENGSLGDRVDTSGPMPVEEVLDVGVRVGGALAVAHASGLVHRDIKPANILVDRHGTYKLADFGIALDLGRAEGLTHTAMIMGTWAYMPPEQRQNSHEVDPRSDLYAFGVTLYALVVGRSSANLHNQEGWEAAYAGVPPALAKILQRATRYDPEDRYARVTDMVADLARLQDAFPRPAVPSSVPPTVPRPSPAASPAPSTPSSPTLGPPASAGPAPAEPVRAAPPRAAATFVDAAPTLSPTPVSSGWRTGTVLAAVALVGLLGVALLLFVGIVWYVRTPDEVATAAPPQDATVAAIATQAPTTTGTTPGEAPSPVSTPAGSIAATSTGSTPTGSATADVAPRSPDAAAPSGSGPSSPVAPAAPTNPAGTATTTPARTPRIIAVIPDAAQPGSGAAPVTESAPAEATGRVVVRTIPSGATVRLRGRTLTPGAGDTYTLSMGSHTLDVSSVSGEQTRLAVAVKAGETVQICYNFDTNASCGSGP